MKYSKINKGFTLVELVIVAVISILVIYFVASAFYGLIKTQALAKDYISVASLMDQAKSMTVNSKLAVQYGVFFSSSTAVLFKGSKYVSTSTSNQIFSLNKTVNISAIDLVGSTTNQVVFSRLTGHASASGTISVSLKDGSAAAKVIRVYNTGIIEYK